MPDPLTPLERRVYHYLLDFLAEHTYQPSIREIGRRFRIKSTKSVSDILGALAEKGYIRREAGRSRGVHLIGVATAGRTMPVPCYRCIHDTEPLLRPEDHERHITMDRAFLPSDEVFFMRASDDGMIGRGIHRDDYLLIDPSARARDGDLVMARVGDVTLARTLQRRGAALALEAAATGERDHLLGPADDFAIVGVIAGVWRPFHVAADGSDADS
ncbi:MAG TPA: transcriptional repressor LexA [Gemmatimonadaceae bacterium]|nr:transcriptional repressor LexA [Gemmatimonadaceae bacterium]